MIEKLQDNMKYIIWQLEKAPDTNKLHQQGYVEFVNPMSLVGVRKILPHAHWEMAKGTPMENRTYCSKTESRADPHVSVELGEISNQGKRTDLTALAEAVVDNARAHGPFSRVVLERPSQFIRYHRGMEKLDGLVRDETTVRAPPLILWLQSGTGTGKSTWVRNLIGRIKCTRYMKPSGTRERPCDWWDGYDSQSVVWFDEFDSGTVPYRLLLQILDVDVVRVPYKGGFHSMLSSVFIFCTNRDWESIYYEQVDLEPLRRRLNTGTIIIDFHRPDQCPEKGDCNDCGLLDDFEASLKIRVGSSA